MVLKKACLTDLQLGQQASSIEGPLKTDSPVLFRAQKLYKQLQNSHEQNMYQLRTPLFCIFKKHAICVRSSGG